MSTWLGTTYFDNYANYEFRYDLLSQSAEYNTSTVRIYGILHVTGYSVSWDWGSAWIINNSVGLSSYYGNGDYTVITKDYTFSHDANGNFSAEIWGGINTSYKSGSAKGTLTLPHINRYANVTNATDFTDEGNPTITFNNPGGFRINARLEFAGSSIQRDNIPNTGSYTFNLTTEERNLLRSKTPNSNSLTVREVIATCYSGTTESAWTYLDKKMTIVNANPIFSDFDFADINPTTVALTGNRQSCIIGYSNIEVMITPNDIAEAVKSATMSKYRFSIGTNVPIEIQYSSQEVVSGVINNVTSDAFVVQAIDSRNNATPVTNYAEDPKYYDEIYLDKQNSKIERDDNRVGDGAVLTLNGNIWNNSFGDVTNSITSVTYRLKKTTSSTWITGTTTITPTVTNNTFTFTGMIASDNQDTSWDLDSSYNVEVTIEDELSISTVSFVLNSAIPTMSLDKNGVGIMCAYDNSIGGALQVNGKIIDSGKLLWRNPNPTADFSAQTINLSSSDYDVLEFYFRSDMVGLRALSVKCLKGYGCQADMFSTGSATRRWCRRLRYSNATQYISENSYQLEQGSSQITSNAQCVPLYIIGYKTNLFN